MSIIPWAIVPGQHHFLGFGKRLLTVQVAMVLERCLDDRNKVQYKMELLALT